MDPSLLFVIDVIRKNGALSESEKIESIKKAKAAFEDIIKKRPCETCQNPCYAPNSCEFCMKNYLETNFSQWTSENEEVDKLIQDCQKDFKRVDFIVEWIPHSNLQDISYINEGNYYLRIDAIWIEGRFDDWDVEKQMLKRYGPQSVAIKMVPISRDDDQWLQEIRAHLLLTSMISPVIHCYGLTQFDRNNYMIVTEKTEYNLRTYLQNNLHKLDWAQKYKILLDILESLESIHENKLIHGDLNSGAIKYSSRRKFWLISDFKFCKPFDNPTNPPIRSFMAYVAPELMNQNNQNELMSVSSDTYSFGMVMWEVSTGYRPFEDERNIPEDKIISGHRPNIMSETPSHYSELMRKCWNENKSERPALVDIKNKIKNILDDFRSNKMSPNDLELIKAKRSISLQWNFVDSVGIPNQGKQGILAIDYSQISEEEVSDGVGRINFAVYDSKKVVIKTIQVDKSSEKSNASKDEKLLQITRESIGRWEHIYNDSNIVPFLGIGDKGKNKIFLVIPYANGGNLRDYLKSNELGYREKLDLAKDVANGIRKLHKHDIVHENINPKNILIFDGKAKISNLPLPYENKELLKNIDQYIEEDIFNIIGYIDPSYMIGDSDNYKKEMPADIYSFGSLLWEIASETIPYSKGQEGDLIKLFISIKEGHRESDPAGIPDEYIKLYQKCWNQDRSSRPDIKYVHDQLMNMRM